MIASIQHSVSNMDQVVQPVHSAKTSSHWPDILLLLKHSLSVMMFPMDWSLRKSVGSWV